MVGSRMGGRSLVMITGKQRAASLDDLELPGSAEFGISPDGCDCIAPANVILVSQ